MAKTYINKVTFVAETTTPDGKTVRVILPESMVLDFSLGVGFKTQIVEELPETGDPRIIYLVPSEDEKANNVYVEYMYIEGEWECVGSTAAAVNLIIGTEDERLALVDVQEGVEFNETHYDEEEDKRWVVRYIRENGQWVELESPQTESVETVSLHVTTWDGQGVVSGLTVLVKDNNTQEVLNRTLDNNGNCTFDITKGHNYTIDVASLEGYRDIPDQTYTAGLDERSITLSFQRPETNYETINVHVTVYNNQLQDVTAQDTDLIGLQVTCEIQGGQTLTGTIGADHTCQFQVMYGETYTIKEPVVSGFMTRYATSWTHIAGVPMRQVPMHYVQWIDVGIYGIDDAGATYTHENIAQMTAEQKATIKYIGLNTSRLLAAGASFMYRLPVATQSKQWATANVEFDQSLLPFKQSHAAAVLDLDGQTNTESIIDIGDTEGVGTPAADYCFGETITVGGVTKHGFLGAYGQMYALAENIIELTAIHSLLGLAAPGFTSGLWWTSTQCNAGNAVRLIDGGFGSLTKTNNYTTMALFAL